MFTTTFIDKITGIFSAGILLSSGLPALLLLGWAVVVVVRLTDWPVVQLWQDKPTLMTLLSALGVAALAVLIQSLNPLLKRWLTGDAPWIPEALGRWRRRQRQRLEEQLTQALARLETWRQVTQPLQAALITARQAYQQQAAPPQPMEEERLAVRAAVDRAKRVQPHETGPVAGALPQLACDVVAIYARRRLPVLEIEEAHDAVVSAITRGDTLLLEAVTARERTLRTLFPAMTVRPTHFGNVQAALDAYPFTRYGMDGVLLLPRLRAAEREPAAWRGVDDAKSVLDFLVAAAWVHIVVVVFGLAAFRLLLAWDIVLLIALVGGGAALAWLFYSGATHTLMAFQHEVAAAFDLHRWKLLESLHLPRPPDAAAEMELWRRVTGFLTAEPTDEERRQLWYR